MAVEINKNIQSVFFIPLIIIGLTSIDKGIANNTFAIFEPTTFPIAIPEYPLKEAFADIANSGADVPKETIVTATTKVGTFKMEASDTEPLISDSPDINKIIIPDITKIISVNASPTTFVLC